MTLQTRLVEYRDGDTLLEAFLAWDDAVAGQRPAVVIAPTWAGRSAFEEGKARDLAALGYVGFVLDMYGKGRRGASPQESAALMAPLMEDRAGLQRRINRAVAVVREQLEVDPQRVAACGYCFGGLCVLDLARSGSDVRGVVSLHGLFSAPNHTAGRRIAAKILCLHGYDDPMARPESLLELGGELTAAGADWQVHAYGHTVHAFTNPQADNAEMGTVYSATADRRSRAAMLAFLEECFA
ncbi:MAG: dienelactone hydrolase family protein [Pseudomonadales bacterium]|nr:dienelactone hydrolase family protein [Pseudomonadales bacterium]MCP5189006.1 dienelactone hydrolase family protein [Pseudomonadales bacterium]